MSANLISSWKDRVFEVEQEIALVREEISAVDRQRVEVAADNRKYADMVKRERAQLEKKIADTDAKESAAREKLRVAKEQKARISAEHDRVAAGYAALEDRVKQLKQLEADVAHRVDHVQLLQEEAVAWAQDERTLRDHHHALDADVKESRRLRQQEIDALERDVAEAEDELRTARMARVMPAELAGLGGSASSFAVASAQGSRQPSVALVSSKAGSRKRDCLGDSTNNR